MHRVQSVKGLMVAGIILALAIQPCSAFGQRDANAKSRGDFYNWSSKRASRSIRHARDYSADLYSYSRSAEVVDPAVAKAEAERIGQSIEASKKELASMEKDLANVSGAAESLVVIRKYLDEAAKKQKELHEECCKPTADGHVCADCCNEITKSLDKAVAEHDALMRKLGIESAKSSK